MRESQTKTGKKQNIRNRNVRFVSADSGISSSLNMKVPKQRIRSNNDLDGLEEDCLDFEPDVENNSFDENIEKTTPYSYRSNEESTVKLTNSECGDISNFSNALGNGSVSTLSIGHRDEMIPVPKSDPQDGRQDEYISPYFSPSENSRTILDSSSDNFSSTSGSSKFSTEDDSSRSLPGSDNEENAVGDVDERDDTNSVYDITQDEEDQLLCSNDEDEEIEDVDDEDVVESVEEEIPQSNPFSERMIVEKCHNGNMRITCSINTKCTKDAVVTNEVPKTIKRSSTAKSLERRKKKKWDVYFKPDVPPTQIFLNDIGWHCPSFDKIISNEIQNQIISPTASSNDSFNFKLPLPPPKRPPTRPKRSVTNKEESNFKIKVFDLSPVEDVVKERIFQTRESTTTDNSNDTDDSISIIAPSLGGIENNDDFRNTRQYNIDENSDYNTMTSEFSEHERLFNNNYAAERIQSWIQEVPDPVIIEPPIPILNPPVPEYQQDLCENLTTMPPVSAKGPVRINFNDIPSIFSGICYHHYFNGKCVKTRKCNQAHNIVRDKYVHRFQKTNIEDLTKAYQYALKFENFFKDVYPCFMIAFGTLKMQNKLISSIRDFFKMSKIDTTEAVELIIKSLQDSGLSFSETIENISFNIGFLEYPSLADILLDLTTRTAKISDHWEIIKRIVKAKGHIPPKILNTRILRRVISEYPINKDLCMDIYNVIIKNKITDLSEIDNDCLISLQTIANRSNNLENALKSKSPSLPNTLNFPKSQSPINASHELLAAHIDNSLIKEREKFEREVEGRTVRTIITSTLVNSPNKTFSNKYENSGRIPVTSSRNNTAYDVEDSYYYPTPRDNDVTPKEIDNGQFILLNSSSASSTSSRSNFEISAGSNYLPDTRQMNIRNDLSNTSSYQPLNNVLSVRPQYLEFSLTPSRPIFGNANYGKMFSFDRSLHHLLPNIIENVDINERDVSKLNRVIKNKDGVGFLKLLNEYSTPATIRNFITMTIVDLKSCGDYLDDVLLGLLSSLAVVKPDYATQLYIKVVFEVVVMNVLFEFERRSKWENARKLLELFCDWDSLISSQLLQIFSMRKISHMGRYLFLANLFAKAKNFHFTYEILQCPKLHLLESCESWPYFYNYQVDLPKRNVVLTDFFKNAFWYKYNFVHVIDMYRRIYKFGGIDGYDAHGHFNPMLITILNGKQTSFLKHFFSDIELFYKKMDKDVLRAFTILVGTQLNVKDLFRLYELCCERQIYTRYKGNERRITVETNMFDMEIQLILDYFFCEMRTQQVEPSGDVTIQISLPRTRVQHIKMLQTCCRSVQEVNNKLRELLSVNFDIFVDNNYSSQPTVITVKHELIRNWFQGSTTVSAR